MKEYYTYAYLREDGTPYYIGKGKGNRISVFHTKFVKVPPEERRLFLKQNLTEKEAFKHEVYMIFVFGRKDLETGVLINRSDGGAGGINVRSRSFNQQQKDEMRESLPADLPLVFISSVTQEGIQELKDILWVTLQEENKNLQRPELLNERIETEE